MALDFYEFLSACTLVSFLTTIGVGLLLKYVLVSDGTARRTEQPKAQRIETFTSGPTNGIPALASQYRIVEEDLNRRSSEYTARGEVWTHRASWHLPEAPKHRTSSMADFMSSSSNSIGMDRIMSILAQYKVDSVRGFLPSQDPLQRLSYARYHLWEDLGDDLPKLLGARLGQARGPLAQLPVLATDKLFTDAELKRAHLLLSLFAHAYVWGGRESMDVIPEGISKPLCEVSERLGIPPVLGHTSIVLYNWRRLDNDADICMENLSTLNNFFDGRDESWFYLITVEIEARGASAVLPVMLAMDAVKRFAENESASPPCTCSCSSTVRPSSASASNSPVRRRSSGNSLLGANVCPLCSSSDARPLSAGSGGGNSALDEAVAAVVEAATCGPAKPADKAACAALRTALVGRLSLRRVVKYVSAQLVQVAQAVHGMCLSLDNMREGCHPFIFYHRVRPFLSAWKHNPTLPDGVVYEGVFNNERQQFFGGSAAQSPLFPFLDVSLGVTHDSHKSQQFLSAMRDYMLRPHREFLQYMEGEACLRDFVQRNLDALGLTDADTLDTVNAAIAAAVFDKAAPSYGDAALLEALDLQKALLELRAVYDQCVAHLRRFRMGHMSIVADYIIAQQQQQQHQRGRKDQSLAQAKSVGEKGSDKEKDKGDERDKDKDKDKGKGKGKGKQTDIAGLTSSSNGETRGDGEEAAASDKPIQNTAGGKGTGGTDLLKFLKPIVDDCSRRMLGKPFPSVGSESDMRSRPATASEDVTVESKNILEASDSDAKSDGDAGNSSGAHAGAGAAVDGNGKGNADGNADTRHEARTRSEEAKAMRWTRPFMSDMEAMRPVVSSWPSPSSASTALDGSSSPTERRDMSVMSAYKGLAALTCATFNPSDDETEYKKDNGCLDDVDLYRSRDREDSNDSNDSNDTWTASVKTFQ